MICIREKKPTFDSQPLFLIFSSFVRFFLLAIALILTKIFQGLFFCVVFVVQFLNLPIKELANFIDYACLANSVNRFHKITSPIAGWFMSNVNLPFVAPLIPNPGIHLSNALIAPFAQHLNKFDKEEKVVGLRAEQAVWMVEAKDRKPYDPVIIYTHGGGYALGCTPTFSALAFSLYHRVKNDRLSIIILDYSIASEAKCPTQLCEMALLYNHIAKTSQNIWLMGDSAGAHLSLHLMRHIGYPVSGIPPVTLKPKGAVLLSPCVNLKPLYAGSFVSNDKKDYLNFAAANKFGDYFLDYCEALYDSPELNFRYDESANWERLLPDASKVFVTIGSEEVLKDEILAWVKIANLPESSVFIDQGAIHDCAVLTPGIDSTSPHIVKFLRSAL